MTIYPDVFCGQPSKDLYNPLMEKRRALSSISFFESCSLKKEMGNNFYFEFLKDISLKMHLA